MGFLDSLKNALGGKKEPEADVTVAPSQVLREAGIDPSGIKFGFGDNGRITISGTVSDENARSRIVEIIAGIDGVNGINDEMNVASPRVEPVEIPAAEPEPHAGSVDAPGGAGEDEGGSGAGEKTYTVQPGDTLWKISEEHYGNGANYMKIFEANRDLLDDPNKIFPGQELVIPDPGE
jgi:nucleoid-associated protein YgaU